MFTVYSTRHLHKAYKRLLRGILFKYFPRVKHRGERLNFFDVRDVECDNSSSAESSSLSEY